MKVLHFIKSPLFAICAAILAAVGVAVGIIPAEASPLLPFAFAGIVGAPPSLEELRKYAVNRPGEFEVTRQSLYDFTAYAAAGQTQLLFFQVPAGQAAKTKADTNMETAGSLPNPKHFLIESIHLFFFPGVNVSIFGANADADYLNDVQDVFESGFLELFVGSKTYLTEAPLGRFPASNHLVMQSSAASGTTLAADSLLRNAYAAFGGKPYTLNPPILLVPTQNFSVSLNWPVAVALPSGIAGRIGVVLNGLLYRNSQ